LPPPQADIVINKKSIHKKIAPKNTGPCRLRGLLLSSTSPGNPENASHSASLLPPRGRPEGYMRLAEVPAVVTVTATDAVVVPLSVTELGETEHVD
jgi:hypothetical protein